MLLFCLVHIKGEEKPDVMAAMRVAREIFGVELPRSSAFINVYKLAGEQLVEIDEARVAVHQSRARSSRRVTVTKKGHEEVQKGIELQLHLTQAFVQHKARS